MKCWSVPTAVVLRHIARHRYSGTDSRHTDGLPFRPVKILFLLNDGFGIGGTITTTFNLGSALAARGHQVEVLSTMRRRDMPHMSLHPAVRLMALVEVRTGHPDYAGDDPRHGQPARFYPKADYRASDYDRYTEDRYRRYLRGSDADAIIATRPGLLAYLAAFGPSDKIKIGQEHWYAVSTAPPCARRCRATCVDSTPS